MVQVVCGDGWFRARARSHHIVVRLCENERDVRFAGVKLVGMVLPLVATPRKCRPTTLLVADPPTALAATAAAV